MAFRTNYWSCSKLADWIRGTPKLKLGTSQEWNEWEQKSKSTHPIRYWIAEEGLDLIQDIWLWIPDKLNSIRTYINNRWVSRTHALTAHRNDIKPGTWCDVGERFLPCLFNELKDFVEIEQAWYQCLWDKKSREKYNMPWYHRKWYTRWGREWRCPQAGIDYLIWASSLVYDEDSGIKPDDELYKKPTSQAIAAKEVLALYLWWTEVYPNRPDPWKLSGWNEYESDKSCLTSEVDDKAKEIIEKYNKIEEEYNKQDEEMLIRLIKIRKSLWT